MKHRLLVVALLGLTVLAACGSSSYGSNGTTADNSQSTAGSGGTDAPSGGSAGITVSNYTFQVPATMTAGESATITNNDPVAHTFSDAAGSFSVDLPAGGSASLTVPAAGTYEVVCHIHSSMKATLVVS
jgi:plastocyanin